MCRIGANDIFCTRSSIHSLLSHTQHPYRPSQALSKLNNAMHIRRSHPILQVQPDVPILKCVYRLIHRVRVWLHFPPGSSAILMIGDRDLRRGEHLQLYLHAFMGKLVVRAKTMEFCCLLQVRFHMEPQGKSSAMVYL